MQKLQLLLKDRLDKNTKIFFAELIGTFIAIVFATGSVVLDTKLNGVFTSINSLINKDNFVINH